MNKNCSLLTIYQALSDFNVLKVRGERVKGPDICIPLLTGKQNSSGLQVEVR